MNQELIQAIKDTIRKQTCEMHTALPGKVISYDPSRNLAVVKPTMQFKKPDGSKIEFPEISGVPVVFPQGAGQKVGIAFPIRAGDSVLLLIAEQALDYWMYGQETGTDLRFDLSNAIALPSLFPVSSDIIQKANEENAVVVKSGPVVLTVKGSRVEIDGDLNVNGNIHVTKDLTVDQNVMVRGDVTAEKNISATQNVSAGQNVSVGQDITVTGTASAEAVQATTITATQSMSTGELTATSNITSESDVMAAGKSLATHTHSCPAEGGTSGPPI